MSSVIKVCEASALLEFEQIIVKDYKFTSMETDILKLPAMTFYQLRNAFKSINQLENQAAVLLGKVRFS